MTKEIYYFEYLDHAYSEDSLDEIKEKPFILWAIGYIYEEQDEYIVVVPEGAKYREKVPKGHNLIVKSCIKKKELIYTIPDA